MVDPEREGGGLGSGKVGDGQLVEGNNKESVHGSGEVAYAHDNFCPVTRPCCEHA